MNLHSVLKISLHLSDLYDSRYEPCAETSWKIRSGVRDEKAENAPLNKAGRLAD